MPRQNDRLYEEKQDQQALRELARELRQTPHRMEVWFAELGYHGNTSVQDGCRPVIIVSNDDGNHHADTICVLPMTSKLKKAYLPSHVEIGQDDLQRRNAGRAFEPSMVLAEQITTISKTSLRSYLGIVEAGEKTQGPVACTMCGRILYRDL